MSNDFPVYITDGHGNAAEMSASEYSGIPDRIDTILRNEARAAAGGSSGGGSYARPVSGPREAFAKILEQVQRGKTPDGFIDNATIIEALWRIEDIARECM